MPIKRNGIIVNPNARLVGTINVQIWSTGETEVKSTHIDPLGRSLGELPTLDVAFICSEIATSCLRTDRVNQAAKVEKGGMASGEASKTDTVTQH